MYHSKRLYEHYRDAMFPSFEIFCKPSIIIGTENYECLEVHNNGK